MKLKNRTSERRTKSANPTSGSKTKRRRTRRHEGIESLQQRRPNGRHEGDLEQAQEGRVRGRVDYAVPRHLAGLRTLVHQLANGHQRRHASHHRPAKFNVHSSAHEFDKRSLEEVLEWPHSNHREQLDAESSGQVHYSIHRVLFPHRCTLDQLYLVIIIHNLIKIPLIRYDRVINEIGSLSAIAAMIRLRFSTIEPEI